MLSKAEILVTGGCGFIGTHLVKKLLTHGYNVTVLDSIDPQKAFPVHHHHHHHHDNNYLGNVKFVHGSVLDMDTVRTVTKNVQQVIHLAALIDAEESMSKPLPYMATNILGTRNILTACVENNIEKFIFSSTAAVYGHCTNMPISEDEKLQPISPYGQSKVVAEEHIREYQRDFGLNTTILRMFNVYGPGQQQNTKRNAYSGVITRFMENLINSRDLVIFGDGGRTRDFLNIADAINAFMLALKNRNISGTFNIGTGLPTSISQLANKILELQKIEKKSENLAIRFMPERKGDIRHSCPDISRAASALGYTPTVALDRGLEELYRHKLGKVTPSMTKN